MSNPYSRPDELTRARDAARERRPRSDDDLARAGYSGQGYQLYGEPREQSPARESEEKQPGWFGAGTSAHAFGYTTSLHDTKRAGHSGAGPKGYVRSDSRLLEDVCDRLSDDDQVDASDISVSVNAGEVSLRGSVLDRHSKRRAENIALNVRGVTDVQNELRVQKGLLREIKEQLGGDDDSEHHGHQSSGTRIA